MRKFLLPASASRAAAFGSLSLLLSSSFVPALTVYAQPADTATEGVAAASTEAATSSAAAANNDAAAAADPVQNIQVSAQILGPSSTSDAGEIAPLWGSLGEVSVVEGTTAADLSGQLFSAAGLTVESAGSGTSWYLQSVTSPATGEKLGWNAETEQYWQLFINGVAAPVGAGAYTLSDGDQVVWYYSAYGASLPAITSDSDTGNADNSGNSGNSGNAGDNSSNSETDTEGGASTVELSSAEGSFHQNAGLVEAPTPTDTRTASWKTLVGGNGAPVSEPVVVGKTLVLASGSKLLLVDTESGSITAEIALAGPISYTSRPAAAAGVAYVPLDGGRVQAIDLVTRKTLWTSDATSTQDQSSCTLNLATLAGKQVVLFGTGAFNSSYQIASGSFVALDAQTGAVVFNTRNNQSGYYWTGAATCKDFLCIGDQAGVVHVFDATGVERASITLSAAISGDLVAYGNNLLVVTRDGVLHKLTLNENNQFIEQKLQVLSGSSAPISLAGALGVVTGSGATAGSTAFALVNVDNMTVERVVDATETGPLPQAASGAFGGGSKAPALIGSHGGELYVYLTVNHAEEPNNTYTSYASGGNAYVYRVGDRVAKLLYAPAAGTDANYCDSPLVADEAGNLYYLNDSGYLVRLSATADKPAEPETPTTPEAPQPGQGGKASGGKSNGGKGSTSASGNTNSKSESTTFGTTHSAGSGAKLSFGAGQSAGKTTAESNTESKSESKTGVSASNNKNASTVSGEQSSASTTGAQEQGQTTSAQNSADKSAHQAAPIAPWWPFAGMVAGAAGVLVALFKRPKNKERA